MEKFLLIMFVVLHVTYGFYPRQPPYWTTKTHADITNAGVLQAIAHYIKEENLTDVTSLSTAIDDFFGKDLDSRTEMHKTINAVKTSIADTQGEKRDIAYVHCHADQIKLAHNHVIACKDGLLPRKDNLMELRKQIGVCLYTIQSFYSNTNWVEMKGRVPYDSFGIKGQLLMAVATGDEDTCKDMPDFNKNCKDNILVTDKLTSGYHHARGNVKPPRPLGSVAGKCSHGGPTDESRKLIAKCGINKETTLERLSPHYHLHMEAYYAAVDATKRFFISNDTGMLSLLGHHTFRSLFNIKKRRDISLSFAVDYSGSMAEEIAMVKENIIQLVYSTINSANEPADYVLSLFNDPASMSQAFVFTNGFDMVKKVSDIKVISNFDCPELSASGTLKAIELSRRYSTVFVFTDADAKDANRRREVIDAAIAKNIKITPLLTGKCGSKKRRDAEDRRHRETDFYDAIAEETGGTVYRTEKENIDVAINEVVEKVFPTLEVIIGMHEWPATMVANQDVVIDGSIQMLKISIKGASSISDVDILYPNGTNVQLNPPTASRIFTSNKEIIMSLKLFPWTYILHKTRRVDLVVNITAQSSIKVESEMLENTISGSLISMNGSPINGKKYTYSFTVFNLGNGTCDSIVVVGTDGRVLYDYNTTQTENIDATCTADIAVPNEAFQIMLYGSDNDGHTFRRTTNKIYKPTIAELRVHALSDDIPLMKETDIPYEIINTGKVTVVYDVRITDEHSFAVEPVTHQHTIKPGETANGTFILLPNSMVGLTQCTVILALQSTSETQQSISKSFVVTNIQRPVCHVMATSGICDPPSLNTANCSLYKWNSEISVNFSDTQLDNITATGGMNVNVSHDNITGVDSGPLMVNASGNCCTPSVTVSVVDVDGRIDQCYLDFSDGKPVLSVKPEDKTTNTAPTQSLKMVVCIITVMTLWFGFNCQMKL